MKSLLKVLILFAVVFTSSLETQAQRAVTIASNVDIGDSLVYNLSYSKDVHKWSGFHVEVLGQSLAAADTTAKVEIYNTINNDFTDATDLDTGSALILADGAGGTGTIMKSVSISNSNLENLRIVIDPSASDSGSGKVTIRLKPTYKSAYTAPD